VAEHVAPRYRFGPLEDRGIFLGLRLEQVLAAAPGVVLALALVSLGHSWVTVLAAVAMLVADAAVCFLPVGGRTVAQWGPLVGQHVVRRALGRDRHLVEAPLVGLTMRSRATMDLPPELEGVEILSAPLGAGELGVIKDSRRHTYTGVLLVRGLSFALLGSEEKAGRFAAYADLLSGIGRDGGGIARLQWVDIATPDDGEDMVRFTARRRAMPLDSAPVRSLLSLLERAAPVTQVHETYLAVQIEACSRAVRRRGGGDQAACIALAHELDALRIRVQDADLHVDGVLSPGGVARVVRLAYDPGCRAGLSREGVRQRQEVAVDPTDAWPMATHDLWSLLRTDTAFHRTYWVKEWPRCDVGPDWLAPLLVQCRRHLRVGVTMQPVPATAAERDIRGALAEDLTNARLRERAGWRTSARTERETQQAARREAELADGWAPYRYSAYLTVTAGSPEELEEACADVEQHAVNARLQLRRLGGQQGLAFTYTLPLCRGLR
jgi:hypothetical protein